MCEERDEVPAAEMWTVDESADGEESNERQQRATQSHDGWRPADAFVPAIIDQHAGDEEQHEHGGDAAMPAKRSRDGEPCAEEQRESADDERGPGRDEAGRNRARGSTLGIPARVERVVEDHPADIDQGDADEQPEEREQQAVGVRKTVGIDVPEQPAGD